jgi:BirA family biotin operon repressor/biotin-[acetyl-CoA-carboxylase] ligase
MLNMQFEILRFDSLTSTNTEALKRAVAGASEGLCIVAREQTAGRGRHKRTWVSPMNSGLYSSTIFRPQFDMQSWPLITMMAAVAVHNTLRSACGLVTDIKWPNDILAGEKKLCGILAETVETPTGRACVLGIGINLRDGAFPPEIADNSTSVECELARTQDGSEILRSQLDELGAWYAVLSGEQGATRLVEAWCARSSYAMGRRVRVTLHEEILSGITRGLEKDGALRVETDSGEIQIIRAGDVTALR